MNDFICLLDHMSIVKHTLCACFSLYVMLVCISEVLLCNSFVVRCFLLGTVYRGSSFSTRSRKRGLSTTDRGMRSPAMNIMTASVCTLLAWMVCWIFIRCLTKHVHCWLLRSVLRQFIGLNSIWNVRMYPPHVFQKIGSSLGMSIYKFPTVLTFDSDGTLSSRRNFKMTKYRCHNDSSSSWELNI